MQAMKSWKSFIAIPLVSWLAIFISCKEEPIEVMLPVLTPEQQLLFFLEDSSIYTESRYVGLEEYYFRLQDTIPGDTGTLDDGDVIYFHYSLAFIAAYVDSIYVNTDSASIDTIRLDPIEFSPFDFNQPSQVGKLGVDAIWPTGLDQVLQQTNLREGETYIYYLPPQLAYQEVKLDVITLPGTDLTKALDDLPVQIGIRIDSIKTVDQIRSEARLEMIQYLADAEIRDTTVVPGGPVVVLSGVTGDPVYFKRLSPIRSGISPIYGDSVRISFNYRFVNDSLNGNLGALENPSTNGYRTLMDAISSIGGIQTGLLALRTGERAFMMFGPELAYREGICFIPALRQGNTSIAFYGRSTDDPEERGSVKQFLRTHKVVPSYAFQTEPFRSYIFEVTLDQVY